MGVLVGWPMDSLMGSWMLGLQEIRNGGCASLGRTLSWNITELLFCCKFYLSSIYSLDLTRVCFVFSGAWMALTLWDHFTYTNDYKFLEQEFLPAFRGIAEFFNDYLLELNDELVVTGPTTSPETSYSIIRSSNSGSSTSGGSSNKKNNNNGGLAGVYNVAFSPAIDNSILRQAANAYFIALELLETPNHGDSQYHSVVSTAKQLEEHRRIGKK